MMTLCDCEQESCCLRRWTERAMRKTRAVIDCFDYVNEFDNTYREKSRFKIMGIEDEKI